MGSPNALRWRFEVCSVCTFTATKSRDRAPRLTYQANVTGKWRAPLTRDGGSVPLRAVAAQIIGVGGEVHPRLGDLLRAVLTVEIEHLVVLVAAVLAISPEP